MKNVSTRYSSNDKYIKVRELFERLYKEKNAADDWIILNLMQYLRHFDLKHYDFDILGELYNHIQSRKARNANGRFYTPPEIIRYVMSKLPLNDFVREMEKGSSPKILDPSCGTGGFLLAFQDEMQDIMLMRNWSQRDINRALQKSIYGIDIDEFAIQLSKLNMAMKENISNVNQISSNFYTEDAVKTPICGNEGNLSAVFGHRFMFVVGNPPYYEMKRFPRFVSEYPMLASSPIPNISSLFFVRYTQLLSDGGILVFLLPASLLFSDRFIDVRKYLLDRYSIIEVVHLGKAFSEVGLEQVIVFLQNKPPEFGHTVRVVFDIENLEKHIYKETITFQKYFLKDRKYRFRIFMDKTVSAIVQRIESRSEFLINHAYRYIDRGGRKIAIFRGMGWERDLTSSRDSENTFPAIKGTNIMRYGIKDYYYLPNARKSTTSHKFRLITTRPKIVLQRLVSSKTRLVATSDNNGILTISTIENLMLNDDAPWDQDFIVGILNSDLISLYVIDQIFMRSRLTTSLDQEYLGYLPVPVIDKAEQARLIEKVHRLKSLVEKGIEFKKPVKEIEVSEEYIAINRELNRLVYKYYDLTEHEIGIVETRLNEFYNK
ncbi:MAG: N-6 DNA methylase [Candidatus Heimdallarchaeota archaeon]